MIKVCFYGAESTGKTEMAKRMAEFYRTVFVPEVAREFVSSNDFTEDDIIKIGYAQTERINELSRLANRILFCDTDLITTQIYCRHYLGSVPPILLELEKRIAYNHYFLFDIDVPWVSDGLRDLGEQRQEMHQKFKFTLEQRNIEYSLVHGSWDDRFEIIKNKVDAMLNEVK